MGMPTTSSTAAVAAKNHPPRRRSTEDFSHRQNSESQLLEPEDFKDVFGGPPRTVISRQFSAGDDYFPRSSSTSFYEEIFKPMEKIGSVHVPVRRGRNLPEFRIPAEKGARKSNRFEGFYSDIFGWNEVEVTRSRTRSRSKSKTSSSSVLSSEDLSPLRPAIGGGGGGNIGDRDVSLFASKLRPINVPRRWNSSRQMQEDEQEDQKQQEGQSNSPSYINIEFDYLDNLRSSNYGFCQRNPSPETISLDQPNSHGSFKASISMEDFEVHNNYASPSSLSSSSIVSSLCHQTHDQGQETMACTRNEDVELEDDDDEAMSSSYVIEINGGEHDPIGVDEAIAWAKEKFRTHCSAETTNSDHFSSGQKDGKVSIPAAEDDEQVDHLLSVEEKQQLETKMEMELLDEKIRLWSIGKEADIRLLLSTLHHILWEDSGWLAVPLTNLIESSQVKKAYQKARLFLHPDKLQQRGASVLQKYVANKAFPILQDAWAAFVSQDGF